VSEQSTASCICCASSHQRPNAIVTYGITERNDLQQILSQRNAAFCSLKSESWASSNNPEGGIGRTAATLTTRSLPLRCSEQPRPGSSSRTEPSCCVRTSMSVRCRFWTSGPFDYAACVASLLDQAKRHSTGTPERPMYTICSTANTTDKRSQ
jgi:hypothetical protein